MIYQDSGEVGRICADNMNSSTNNLAEVLKQLGQSTCNMLEYNEMVNVDIVRQDDDGSNSKYVDMVSPTFGNKRFITTPCLQR